MSDFFDKWPLLLRIPLLLGILLCPHLMSSVHLLLPELEYIGPPLKRCQSATRLVVVLTNCGVGKLVSKLYKAVFSAKFLGTWWFSITGALVLQPKLQRSGIETFLAAQTHDVSGRHLPPKKSRTVMVYRLSRYALGKSTSRRNFTVWSWM